MVNEDFYLNNKLVSVHLYHMEDYEFSCMFYVDLDNPIVIDKSQMKYKDADNYLVILDTTAIGIGRVRARVTANIPDDDFDKKTRKEIVDIDTGIVINK